MDRIDAMKVFVAALDEGSLAGAARRLRRSPAAVSRAIAFLEARAKIDPKSSEVLYHLAGLLAGIGQREQELIGAQIERDDATRRMAVTQCGAQPHGEDEAGKSLLDRFRKK